MGIVGSHVARRKFHLINDLHEPSYPQATTGLTRGFSHLLQETVPTHNDCVRPARQKAPYAERKEHSNLLDRESDVSAGGRFSMAQRY